MKRREFLKQSLSASAVVVGAGYASWDMIGHRSKPTIKTVEDRAQSALAKVLTEKNPTSDEGVFVDLKPAQQVVEANPQVIHNSRPALAYEQHQAERQMAQVPEQQPSQPEIVEEIVLTEEHKNNSPSKLAKPKESATTVQEKVANFETDYSDDVILNEADYAMLVASFERINRVQDYVGFGNFNVISFDDALKYAKYSPRIGEFTQQELDFLDQLFNYESSNLGFFGEKVVQTQTNVIPLKDVVKMPGTGHFVFRGHSEEFYKKIRTEIGDSLILTSGVRNVVKQYQLYMAKTVQASGNLSRASRSLAPPGHSYHAVGDFDVGQVGGGLSNFTAAFAKTDEFKRLQDLGYVKIRYTANNKLGVRYEPWHIRVV